MEDITPEEKTQILAEIERKWAAHNPTFKTVNPTGMEYTMQNGFLLVTPQNTIEACFSSHESAVNYANVGQDVRFLLDLLRTRNEGQNTSLQPQTEPLES